MARPRLLDEAAAELAAAAALLEEEQPGYARVFLEAYEEKLRQLARFPESGPVISNVASPYQLRAFRLRRFRYAIIAATIDEAPTIIAVAHTRQEPGYWRARVK